MRVAVLDPKELVGELVGVAGRRRGWAVALTRDLVHLERDIPFKPAAVVVVAPGDSSVEADVRALRSRFRAEPILVLSDERVPADRVHLLRAGASDVLAGPADPVEAVLRVEAWDDPAPPTADLDDTPRRVLGDLEVDLGRYRAVKNGVPLKLTALELRILYCLIANHPNVAPLERFVAFAWNDFDDADVSLIRTHVCHIRRKLEQAGGVPLAVRSKPKVGYGIEIAAAG